ncbi:MAG: aspartate aminotransferase family protein [Pseudomonadota bacterium]
MDRLTSQAEWRARAAAVLPAGGFGNFDPSVVIARGEGSRVWDADGVEYVDYLIGSGPMLLGHGHPEVLEAVYRQLPRGMTFFANNPSGIELAEDIIAAVPCAQSVRFVASGGEADMYAIRAARAFTGRPKLVKFEGGYHGMSAEAQMSLAPSRPANFPHPIPDSAGISNAVASEVLVAPFNDIDALDGLLREHAGDVAAVIAEPLQRIVPAQPGFPEALREVCTRHDVLLIFDEIVTGFRLDYGGAQERYGVVPDLATFGKIIGGGFPLAAITGRANIMAHFDKNEVGSEGWLMQLGTLSGNPVASVAGMKTMEILRREGQYDRLKALGGTLQAMMTEALTSRGIPHQIVGDTTLFDVVFTDRDVLTYRDSIAGNADHATTWNRVLRENGVFKSPGKVYPHLALTDDDLDLTRRAVIAAAEAL